MMEGIGAARGRSTPRGHAPTLLAAFLYFDGSFMLWVLLGALGVYIDEALSLTAAERGLIVALPILSGSLLRIPLGAMADRFGAKRVGAGLLLLLFLPLALGWQAGGSLPVLLAVGLLLGTAGASFAVALPLASRWYPAERQGVVMGIAAAGNSGTVIANLAAPRLAEVFGWQNVLGAAMLPLSLVLAAFLLLAREATSRSGQAAAGRALRQPDLWWFCLFYSLTFGGYVGLTSFLPLFLRAEYHTSPATGGLLTAGVALVGSSIRPLGGYLADRLGGVRVLSTVLLAAAGLYAGLALLPPLTAMMGLAVCVFACLGLGNGALFQLVPRRFPAEVGLATGVIGALGGAGGFLLPNLLSNAEAHTGSFAPAFLALAGAAAAVSTALRALAAFRAGWRDSWRTRAPARHITARRVQMEPYWSSP